MKPLAVALVLFSLFTFAHAETDLALNPGLKRFDQTQQLGTTSKLDIQSIRTGDNVLEKALLLQEQGGKVHHISGGSRSRKVNVSFFQPYQKDQLVQQFALNFDKDKGFITSLDVTYKLDNAYLDIRPVYQEIIKGAIARYGAPLSIQDVRQLTGTQTPDVRLSAFKASLQPQQEVSEQVMAFFEKRIITPKARFIEAEGGHALLISGFNECYLWPIDAYSELLTLCAFRASSGNMKGQGIDLSLVNFAVQNRINEYSPSEDNPLTITF